MHYLGIYISIICTPELLDKLSAVFMNIMKVTGIATLHYYKPRVCVQNNLVLSHTLNLILLAHFYSCYLSFHRLNIRGSWAFIILICLIFNFLGRIIIIFYFVILIKPLSLQENNPVTRNVAGRFASVQTRSSIILYLCGQNGEKSPLYFQLSTEKHFGLS